MHKQLRFAQELVSLITSGEKESTWRLWDDKDLSEGDIIDLVDRDSNKSFARGRIIKVVEKPLGELTAEDKKGHEPFESEEHMYKTFEGYYNRPVDKNTLVKIIRFELVTLL